MEISLDNSCNSNKADNNKNEKSEENVFSDGELSKKEYQNDEELKKHPYSQLDEVKTYFNETHSFQNEKHLEESNLSECETERNGITLSQRFEELLRKTRELAEENARLKKEIVKLPVTPLQAKCLEPYMKTLKECKVYYDSEANVAILKGPHYVMQKCHCDFLVELRKVKEMFIPISTDIESILSSEKGKMFLEKLNSLELKLAFVELNANSLVVASIDEVMLNEAVQVIKEKVDYTETFIGKADIHLDKINTLKIKIEFTYMAKVTWEEKKSQLVVIGLKDDVLAARKEVEDFLEDYGVSEKSFDIGQPLANYFFSCLEDQVKLILKPVNIIDYTFTKHQIALRFLGSKFETRQVLRKLEDLKMQIKILKWDLLKDFKAHEIFLIINNFNSGNLNNMGEKYLYKKVLLDFSKLSSFNLLSAESKKKITHLKSNNTKQVKVSTVRTPSSLKCESLDEITYHVTSTCQLIIKLNGNIVEENSDILVSVLGTDLDLRRTRVGGAFHHACKSHWKEVKSSSFANHNPLLVTVKNPRDLTCMAVSHVILEPWNPFISNRRLISTLQQVLNEAKALGAKTISFPPLGCGQVFQFPPSDVAQAMFQVFQSMNVGSFLQKVVLIAPDHTLFNDLKQQASLRYSYINNFPLAVAGTSPIFSLAMIPEESSDDSSEDSDDDDSDALEINNPNNDKNQCSTEIVITAHSENIPEQLICKLNKDLTHQCLYTDYYNQDFLNVWPRESSKKIIDKAKKLSVWVERSQHPKTKYIGYIIKGEQHAVNEMKMFIHEEFHDVSKHLPKQRLISSKAPKRGTLDFLRYAADSDEWFPSYWSLNQSKSFFKSLTSIFRKKQSTRKILVDVDQETKDSICNLVIKTFDPQLVGQGNDAFGLNHFTIKVLNVQRIENLELFEAYRDQRRRMFRKMLQMQQLSNDIGTLIGSKGRVQTTQFLSNKMKQELYYEVNEQYLFHGAKAETIKAIIHDGIDPKLSSDKAMFGKGVYTAERSTKADQYTDSRQRTRNGTKLKLILVRMLLGNVYVCDQSNKYVAGRGVKKLSRAPCMKCFEDKCLVHQQIFFDSVMGDGEWLFREFVVYEKSQCYPEYVITYQRI